MRFKFIQERSKEFEVRIMCKVLEVSASGYYAWRHRPVCARRTRQAEATEKIRRVHEQSSGSYGSPRVTVELKEAKVKICKNTVAKYMRLAGICVKRRRRFVPCTTDSVHPHPIAANVLDRDFTATRPNQKWVGDLTFIPTDEGWMYLSVMIDLFSRKVVGWSMSGDMTTPSIRKALEMALLHRRPKGDLLHHSDRGSQYACQSYRQLLDKHGIKASMSRKGNCYDNAVAESFFGTLKTELIHRQHYRTHAQARASIFHWIECWYNRKRRHSTLGYLSPEAFETQNN